MTADMIRKEIEKKLTGVNFSELTVYDDTVEITIEGDWKHDHLLATKEMRKLGCSDWGEKVIEEDGSDFYTSIHIYKLKPEWRV